MRAFHKPVHRPGEVIESWRGDGDPATASRVAHDTAAALLHRVRACVDPVTVERVISYADEHGIDDVVELWADARPDTLPGALWRIYLLRHLVREDPQRIGYAFSRGVALDQVNQAVAGAPDAPSPNEVVDLATRILRGAFTGDFAVALERASAFCRILATGCTDLAAQGGGRADGQREAASAFAEAAHELRSEALLWRRGDLG